MFKFSWQRILKASEGDIACIFNIFRMLVNRQLPKNRYDPIYPFYQKDFSGISFLVGADVLLRNANKYTRKEVVEYIAMASYRSLAEYVLYGTKTLDLICSPIDPYTYVNRNRLLSIEDERIHFLYERSPKEIK